MKKLTSLGCLLALAFAATSAFAQKNWFTAYDGTTLLTTGGTWADVAAGFKEGHFKSWEAPLKFTPTSPKTASLADATITTTVKFTAMDVADVPTEVETGVKAGLTVVEDDNSNLSYYGIVNNGEAKSWQPLTGSIPTTEEVVTVKVLLETVNNVTTIKYMIGETPLTCASGYDFTVDPNTTISSIEYLGECWLSSLASVYWDNPCTLTFNTPDNAVVWANGAKQSGSSVQCARGATMNFEVNAANGYMMTVPTGSSATLAFTPDDSDSVTLGTGLKFAAIPSGADVPSKITVDETDIAARKEAGAAGGDKYLVTKQANDQLGWVNYSLGIADNAEIAPTNAVQGSKDAIAVNFGVEVAPKSGCSVTYTVGDVAGRTSPNVALDGTSKIVDVTMVLKDEANESHNVKTVKVGVMETGKEIPDGASGTTFDIVSVPFDSFGGGDKVDLNSLFNVALMTAGDKLYVPNGEGDYITYSLTNDGKWEKPDTAKLMSRNFAAAEPEEPTVDKGAAIWVERNVKSQIVMTGVASTGAAESKTAAAPTTGKDEAWSLIANPSINPLSLSAITPSGDNDMIIVETAGAPIQYQYMEIEEEGVWAWAYMRTEKVNGRNRKVKTKAESIPGGMGFWYVNTGNEDVTINFPSNVPVND